MMDKLLLQPRKKAESHFEIIFNFPVLMQTTQLLAN